MGRLASSESVPLLFLQHQQRRRKEPRGVGWSRRLQAQEHKGEAVEQGFTPGSGLDQTPLSRRTVPGCYPSGL